MAIKGFRHKGLEQFGAGTKRGIQAKHHVSRCRRRVEHAMNQQTLHDLWHVERRRKKLHVAKLSAA